jgi:F0F1-type ATP synthase gamma subunit
MNAMKGIAADRVHPARTQRAAVDSYAATIASSMLQVLDPDAANTPHASDAKKPGLPVFCA